MNNLSGAYHQSGQPTAALDCLRRALELNRRGGDRKIEGTNLYNLGLAYLALDRTDEADDALREALAIHHDIGNHYGEGMTLGTLGVLHQQQGEHRIRNGTRPCLVGVARPVRRSRG